MTNLEGTINRGNAIKYGKYTRVKKTKIVVQNKVSAYML
jgi:hypothetical protein